MPEEVLLARLSWTDYAARLKRDPIVLVPVGAIEQHGPHLPLSTDCLIPEAVAEGAAREVGGLVAPTLALGCKSIPRCGGGQHFPGTISLDATTLIAQIKDLVRELCRHGVRRIAFLIGHMENQWFVTEACDVALREVRMLGLAVPRLMCVGYWEFLSKATIERVFGDAFPDWSLEHAGVMETSVMLHLHPDLVRLDRLEPQAPASFPPYDLWPYDPATVPASGILNTAEGATAEKGRIFFEEYVGELAAALRQAFAR